jgi:acetylornithine deacetylase/succinyl-diaminopimelate desuccinylase-like protein
VVFAVLKYPPFLAILGSALFAGTMAPFTQSAAVTAFVDQPELGSVATAIKANFAAMATRRPDGRIYGRGAADDKGGLVVHLGTLKVFDGKPPCTVNLILERMEETDSNLEAFVQANPDPSAEEFRSIADLLAGVGLSGSGPVGERLWSRPSVSAIGIDTTTVAGASNVLIPEARAKLSMRIVPGSDPEREPDALVRHLESHAPGVPRWRSSGSTRCLGSAVRPTVPPLPPPGAPWRRPTASRSEIERMVSRSLPKSPGTDDASVLRPAAPSAG